MRTQIFLIDAQSLCYRAFYAVKGLKNSKGQPTNAVFGFCNILRKLLFDLKPTHIAVCFDVGKKTYRQEKFAEYKATRQAMPDALVSQIKLIRQVIAAYNLPVFELEGYEADDVMATLSAKYAGKEAEVVIVTEDKDMGQLVGDHVSVYSARQEKILKASDIKAKFGVRPEQIVDYIALAGDTSDNIPGVPGVGEVSACKLLSEFDTLDNIYKNIEKVKGEKLKEKLLQGKESAFLSRELATLHPEVPLKNALEDLKLKEPNREKLLEIFQELEFRKFVEELGGEGPTAQEHVLTLEERHRTFEHQGKTITAVYDLKLLRKSNIELRGEIFDVYLAGYLLTGGGQYDIAALAWQFLKQKPDAKILEALYLPMKAALDEQGLVPLLRDIEMPLVEVLLEMERNGVRLDIDLLKGMSAQCQAKISGIEEALFKEAGTKFNINSPKQLSEVLFERLKLPVIKKTKTGFSTDEEVLNRLAAQHPLPAMILEYRQIMKLKSTYIDALPQLADPDTRRIHASFNQTGAETGRLSSNNPNLQNIPIRTDLGRQIRAAFIPYAKDDVLLAADYSQVELRILAHLCGDENLKKAFLGDEDIHRYTSSLMFDVPEDKVDEKMRYAAKRINFGIIYGMSAFGLSKDLDISPKEAQNFIDRYFLRYPRVQAFLDQEIEKARTQGYVSTMFNRRRYLPDINNRNMMLRQFAERQAINAPIQGTAADLIKKAMVSIDTALHKKKCKSVMILTVHDELVFNVVNSELEQVADLVRSHMEGVMQLSVPIKVTVKSGKNWLDMKSL